MLQYYLLLLLVPLGVVAWVARRCARELPTVETLAERLKRAREGIGGKR